ncbi:MAG: YceI family protein [Lamprocystis purpurea]|nr:YceI family protein [Lamprocystis purpurea]
MISPRIAGVAVLLLAGAAQAVEFNQVQPEKTKLVFTSKQMGVPVDGGFGRLTGQIRFDPAEPSAASARLEIDLSSIDAGSAEATEEVVGKQWLNVKAFPTAGFQSTSVKALGGDRFEAVGQLTIKGQTRELTAPFTFKQEGAAGVFDGVFVLKRLDFGIGEGTWSDVSTVANEIQITFHVVAASQHENVLQPH